MSEARVPPIVGESDSEDGAQPEKLRLGGMALRNGLLVHGPSHWAAAVRDRAGVLRVASGRKPSLGSTAVSGVPGLRGVLKLAEAVTVIPLVKRALPAAKLPMQDARTLAAMAGAAMIGQLIRSGGARTVAREGAVGLVSVAPTMLALRTGDLAAYHGVEHKSIAAYESDGEASDADKEHDRCGSNLVAPMLGAAAVGNAAARRAGLGGPVIEAAVALGSAAVAVEVFAYAERHDGSTASRLLRRPGYEIQRIVGTREPSADQLEVGRAALDEILRVEAQAS
jgi:uncharacterized protein YqhQ